MEVGVVGLGRLGLPFALLLADTGNQVVGVDVNQETVHMVNAGVSPIVEPGVGDLLRSASDNLVASTDYKALFSAEVILVVVPTPSDLEDPRFDPTYVLDAVEQIGPELGPGFRTVCITSTLMPGTMAGLIKPMLESATGRQVGVDVGLAYSPEFIALGDVLHGLREPDFKIVGVDQGPDGPDMATIRQLSKLYSSYIVPDTPRVGASFVETEVAKLAINVFLTVKIGYANSLARVCLAVGADPAVVAGAVGSDARIGMGFLAPGANAAGPCLPRDARAFSALGEDLGVPTPMSEAAIQATDDLVDHVYDQLGPGAVGVLGLAYKAGAVAVDESLGLLICQRLAAEGRTFASFDELARVDDVNQLDEAQAVIDQADTVLVALPLVDLLRLDFGDRRVITPVDRVQ